ncbi:MAG: sensor histidine kinase [Chloroflexi bacterium]|nr:sensor histidine kinase [Chloroflexota bacterium]MBP8057619.1 sensor histidine kinase [Chloroflexota bacterium]
MPSHSSDNSYLLLNLAAYVTWITIAAASWYDIADSRYPVLIVILLILFGINMVLMPYTQMRPRWFHFYLGLQSSLIPAIYLLEPKMTLIFLLFFILSAQTMLFLPLPTALVWITLFFGLTFLPNSLTCACLALNTLPYVGGYSFFGLFGGALRTATSARQRSDQLLAELQQAHQQLQHYAEQTRQFAAAEERNRLAREMHDSLGHRLTVAVVQLEGAQRLIPTHPERAAQMIGTMRAQLKEALAELRHTVSTLRTPTNTDENTAPLDEALTELVYTFREATGLTIHLQLPPQLPPLTPEQRLAFYRAAQEGLTNVQRHAAAHQAWITLTHDTQHITLTIRDDGQGLPLTIPDGRFGLQGLQERAAHLGGTLTLSAPPEGGTLILWQLPMNPVP